MGPLGVRRVSMKVAAWLIRLAARSLTAWRSSQLDYSRLSHARLHVAAAGAAKSALISSALSWRRREAALVAHHGWLAMSLRIWPSRQPATLRWREFPLADETSRIDKLMASVAAVKKTLGNKSRGEGGK